jgi:hypothetical protein
METFFYFGNLRPHGCRSDEVLPDQHAADN